MQMIVEVLVVLSTDMHMSVGAHVPISGSMWQLAQNWTRL